jgi:esterase
MTFVPAHKIDVGSAAPATQRLFLLHGIYGSSRNWKTFASDFAAARPGLEIVRVDLRNHGESQGAPPPHTLEACAADLEALATALPPLTGAASGHPEIVCGHSFGGKVALAYAARHPRGLAKLILLDSPPGRGQPGEENTTEAAKVLRVMAGMQLPVASRAEAARQIAAAGVDAGVAKWMATNLKPGEEGGYVWHFDLDALAAMLADYWSYDGYPWLELDAATRGGVAVHVVRAARSDRFAAADVQRLAALDASGRIHLHVLEDASHWLHVDNPQGLLALLLAILRE